MNKNVNIVFRTYLRQMLIKTKVTIGPFYTISSNTFHR